MPTLRPLETVDIPYVLALNERNVEALAPMDSDRLRELQGLADRFAVIEHEGRFGGFVLTFTSGTTYDSENYRWFSERYDRDFYYLDRIVLHEDVRRQGLGGFVYDEVEAIAAKHQRLTLEVNLEPRNDASLAFHARRGFVEIGQLGDSAHRVSLMEKPL